jgi:hypothetical protein
MASITLLQYFSSFKRSSAALLGVGIVPALISLRPEWSVYSFPVLGNIDGIARAGAVALTLLVICSGYLVVGSIHIRRHIIIASVITFLSLVFYVDATALYVRKIEIPSRASSILVSVGSERSEFAKKTFGDESDWDMLRGTGLEEEDIQKLWTLKSIVHARLILYLSYLGMILGWTYCFSGYMALDSTNSPVTKGKNESDDQIEVS